ncbi:MAG: hypothetical protein KatS3mg031_1338 [Chitinophagales bacterium]|nr:MAG: hypothetical protein KatS3mg031_1338 [Chitinophagales bacterium]
MKWVGWICMCFPLMVLAQKPALPVDAATGKVIYTEVVVVEHVPQSQLYQRALQWFKTYFPNPASVIKEQDSVAGRISGQHAIYIFKDVEGKPFKVGQVKYRFTVMVKDGRYKYVADDIFRLTSPKEYAEEWLDESHPDKENRFGYARQVHQHITGLIEEFKKAMSAAPAEQSTDW